MRKQVFGRKFKRDANERKALLKGLMNDLVLKESIKTTEEKAKAIKGQVEKLVTKAKVKGAAAHSLLQPYLSPKAVEKVLKDLSVRFADRPGGYTRIIKLGNRFSDNARVALIEWVEKNSAVVAAVESAKPEKSSKTDKVSSITEAAEATAKVDKKSLKKGTEKKEKKSSKAKK